MKKIAILGITLVMILSTVTVIGTTSNNFEETVTEIFEDEENQSSECNCYNGYQVIEFPEKTPEQLAKMDLNAEPPIPPDSLPSQFSWKNYGGDWTTPAKDQASCGSCWAFGALGGLEAAINLASGYDDLDLDLSEQYVLSCLPAAGSCSGGWMSEAIEYIYSTSPGSTGNGINGVPIESCMPYTATDYVPCSDKCDDWDYLTNPPQPDNKLWQIEDYGITSINPTDPAGWDLLKSWVFTYGPIVVDIYASSGWSSFGWSNHNPTDVYEGTESYTTNHAQVLCGWVDDASVYNGGYWILKNSWGSGFGYGGFLNVAYGCLRIGDRDVTWVTAPEWPQDQGGGPGPVNVNMAVFANFVYESEDHTQYPHPGETVEFTDISDGDIALCEWDFDGDNIIDSTSRYPEWTYSTEGDYKVTLTVYHERGLSSNRSKIIGIRENWPPVAVLPREYAGNGLSYSFDGRYSYDLDDGAITSYHWDFDDGTTSNEQYLTHQFPEGDRIYDVVLTVTDVSGAEDSATCLLKIDQTVPPETELVYAPIGALDTDWYRTTPRFLLEATDWTEVISTYYRIDEESWHEYNEDQLIPVSSEGIHNFEYYSVDYYGNEEEVKSETVKIDKTKPTINAIITGGEMKNGWYLEPVTIELTASDDLSGLSEIKYSIDYGEWITYSGPIMIGQGHHVFRAFAADEASNIKDLDDPMHIKIDTDNPETSCGFIGEGNDNIFYKTVEIYLTPLDQGSGIESTYYKIDDGVGGFELYTNALTVNELGEHTITYYSVDKVGNEEVKKTTTFTISEINFDMQISQPENALYLFGIKLINLGKPIVIGKLTIKAEFDSFTTAPAVVDHVEFFVDDVSKTIVDSAPYEWEIDENLLGGHELKVIAYTSEGSTQTKTIEGIFLVF